MCFDFWRFECLLAWLRRSWRIAEIVDVCVVLVLAVELFLGGIEISADIPVRILDLGSRNHNADIGIVELHSLALGKLLDFLESCDKFSGSVHFFGFKVVYKESAILEDLLSILFLSLCREVIGSKCIELRDALLFGYSLIHDLRIESIVSLNSSRRFCL